MSKRLDKVKEIVTRALKKISELKPAEYLRPITSYFNLKLNGCEPYQIYEDYGCIVPFLIWVNKEMGLKEDEIFAIIFRKQGNNDSEYISSTEILEALTALAMELPFSRERNIAKSILSNRNHDKKEVEIV